MTTAEASETTDAVRSPGKAESFMVDARKSKRSPSWEAVKTHAEMNERLSPLKPENTGHVGL